MTPRRKFRFHVTGMIGSLVLSVALSAIAMAQGSGQADNGLPASMQDSSSNDTKVQRLGTYNVQQSIEMGGRIGEVAGSQPMYNTFVDQQSGLRIFQQSLFMQAQPGTAPLFDTLYVESFGWGGDPSNALRLRVNKRSWYSLNASFRRDQNYFDYDLFANPLNPSSTNPALPTINVNSSPHSYYLRRRMYDVNLIVLPQHRLSFFFEYSRNRNEGPSFTTFHEGTEPLLYQAWNTTDNQLRLGATVKVARRTTLTFTQLLDFFKNDTDFSLAPFAQFSLPNGTPVSFGVSWLNSFSPCAVPLNAGVANPVCNGYISYSRTQRFRRFLPTEQLNLSSTALRRVEISGRFAYSNADATTPENEQFNGLVTLFGYRAWNTNGTSAYSRWVTNEADVSATAHLTDHLRLVDSFRFYRYTIPGQLYLTQDYFFNAATVPAPGNMLLPYGTFPTPLLHATGSPADVINDLYDRFLKQSIKSNRVELQLDVGRHAGIRIGYDYRNILDAHRWNSLAALEIFYPTLPNRGNCDGLPLNPDGSCSFSGSFDSEDEPVTINQHTGIVGVWFRPSQNLRADAEVQFMSADNFLTRIDPRHQQQYRANVSYTPRQWMTVAANLNVLEQRNPTQDFAYSAHYRNFGASATLLPRDRLSFDLAYNYSDAKQASNVCYIGSVTVPGSFVCVNDPSLVEVLGNYSTQTHYFSGNLMVKPVKRVTAILGYSLVKVDGSTLILNPLQPLGPLSYDYHQPLASLAVEVAKRIELRGGWNYYQYNENSFTGPTLPRYFHANNTTLSLKYAF